MLLWRKWTVFAKEFVIARRGRAGLPQKHTPCLRSLTYFCLDR